MIWLNRAHFGHDDQHGFDDSDRTNSHRVMKQIAQKSLWYEEHFDAT